MKKLSQEAIEERLTSLPDWSQTGDSLQRTFGFENFVQSMEFVAKVAEFAESKQHHPDILIRYNKVTLTISTHDVGGITAKDFDLAHMTDGITVTA